MMAAIVANGKEERCAEWGEKYGTAGWVVRMAERQGFEPWIEFPLYTLSKRAPSTTRPSLRFWKRLSANGLSAVALK
jgi:hypothetical protein